MPPIIIISEVPYEFQNLAEKLSELGLIFTFRASDLTECHNSISFNIAKGDNWAYISCTDMYQVCEGIHLEYNKGETEIEFEEDGNPNWDEIYEEIKKFFT